MKLDEELHQAELREGEAAVSIAKMLASVPTNSARLRLLRAMKCLVKADQEEPGILDDYVKASEGK